MAGTAVVSVKFSPTAAGAANTTITNTNVDVTSGTVNVTVTGAGVVPVLTATTNPVTTPTAIDFGTQTVNTSATKAFTLSGANLTGNTTVAVTGTGYTISRTSATTGFGTSVTFTPAELTAATAPTVWVTYLPTTVGLAQTGLITSTTTGTGATPLTITLTGNSSAVPVPTLTVNPTALTFSALVGSVSATQTYVLSGVNITGATTVTVAAPYQVSADGATNWGTTINYTAADFPTNTSTKTVYVRFSPTVVAVGGVNNGNAINVTLNGGSTQTVALNGTGVGVPLLAVSPATLTYSQINTTSASQTFTLTGTYITANTVITTAAPFGVSKDGTVYSTSITYTPADLTTAQTVFVQYTSPATTGTTTGSVSVTSTGAVSRTVALSGTSLATPTIVLNPVTLKFDAQPSGTSSAAQTFTLTGANILPGSTTTVTVAAPFSISSTATGTGTSLSYSYADFPNGAGTQTVYVKFNPAVNTISTVTGQISVTSTSATTQTLALTGTSVNSAPTLAAVADQNVCYSTAQQVIGLTGITAGNETNQSVVLSVSSSNPALFATLGVSPVAAGAATLNYTIANNQSGTAVITLTVKDNGLVLGGGTDTYTRTFNITVNPPPVITITLDQPNTIIERGSTATLTATGGGAGSVYTWVSTVPGNIISPLTGQSITIRPGAAATYTVSVTNTCLTNVTTKAIIVEIRNASRLETSNVITPNGDGKNDVWVVRNIDVYPSNNVKVFDKTGKLIFSKTGYNNDWNGYYNGSPLPQGTYYYVVDLGQGLPYRGVISVVRD